MAEIRSTMDLVLERAARMGRASADEMQRDELQRRGMQLGAEFLETPSQAASQLQERLRLAPAEERESLRAGMLTTMLRNLFLPRDENGAARMQRAAEALLVLHDNAAHIGDLCRELQQICERYSRHRRQIQEQLQEQMRAQIQQALARETGIKADAGKIDPTLDPRYAQEWAHIEAELNGQYGQTLEQYRAELTRFSGL